MPARRKPQAKQRPHRHLEKPPPELAVFAANFRAARSAMGLSQRDVSKRTGVTQGWVSEIELARANVTMDTMVAFASLVGRSVVELLTPESPAPKTEPAKPSRGRGRQTPRKS